jgi:16S rRNA (guanine527-N7)-methyltransferase
MATLIQKLLPQALNQNNYDFDAAIQDKFVQYLVLMDRWNQVFNLTAIRDHKDMVWLHILDSLSISPYLHGSRIIDVGTGAGLPGIPLALIYPDKQFVLLDSNSKKTRFLTQTLLELNIKNVEVVHSRSEDYKPEQGFDSILSRAFSSIQVMLAKTEHLLADNGQFLAMKGIYPEQEIQEIPTDFVLLASHKLVIQGLAAERHLISIKKK